MKKLIISLLFVPFVLKAQTDYLNAFTAFTGTSLILKDMPEGRLNYTGVAMIGAAVLNDQLHLVEIHPTKEKWLRFGLYTASVVFDAVGDARFDMGYKKNGKIYQSLSVASLVAIPVLTRFESKGEAVRFVVAVPMLRFAMFDYVYNNERSLPYNYIGSSSHYESVLPENGVGFLKGVGFIAGITLMF